MSQPATATTRTAPRPAARQPAVRQPAARQPAARQPARRPARPAGAGPRLRVVSAPRYTRSRAGLVVVCVGLLLVGLVGLLLMNVSLERGAYDLRDQSAKAEQLRELAQKYAQETRQLEAPEALADRAHKLGMVDAAPGVPFVLPDGRTIGVAEKATAPPSPTVSKTAPSATKATAKTAKTATTAKTARTTTTAKATTPPKRGTATAAR